MVPNTKLREYRRACEEKRFSAPQTEAPIHPAEVLDILDELAALHAQAKMSQRRATVRAW